MKFMRTMLEEKGLMDEILEFEENGVNNTMPIEVVVEFIENCPKNIVNQVNKKLSIIDFHNGDVMNFVEHLARGITHV